MKHFDVYELIDRIRPRPAMYLGQHSLTRMRAFLDGCFFMADEHGIVCCERPDFGGLHDWVAERFGWRESTAGWCNIIVQECGGDEGKALDRFFELIEDYRRSTNPSAAPDTDRKETALFGEGDRMDDWPDAKIRATALWYLGKHAMAPPTWRYTVVGDIHAEVAPRVELQPGELSLVSFFLSAESWYLLTTRRVLGAHTGQQVSIAALSVTDNRWGNFKGHGGVGLETMRLRLADGTEVTLQYETGPASMAPIYFFRYWRFKYPILDKLKAEPTVTLGPTTRPGGAEACSQG